jgi:hypothetical protein
MTNPERDAPRYRIFVDLDGVLSDFDTAVKDLTGHFPWELPDSRMWPRLAKTPEFYTNLPWMPDGYELWSYIRGYLPVVLTGVPRGKWAEQQKRDWCARELGEDVPVITCFSRQKPEKAWEHLAEEGDTRATPVLIDDRERIREAWEAGGGVFIHHRSAGSSIEELQALGL